MRIKREETFHYDDFSGYINKYNKEGKLIFEKSYGDGNNVNKKLIYGANNKIEKEEIESSTQIGTLQDVKSIKKYEYHKNGYRVLTYEIAIRGINEINSPEYILEGKENWNDINKLVSIEEFHYENDELQSISRHSKDENGFFTTSIEYQPISFKEKVIQNNTNTIIEIIKPNGNIYKRITKYDEENKIREESFIDAFLDTIKITEWIKKDNYSLSKSETQTQFFDGIPTEKYTEINLYDGDENIIAKKTYDYWITKSHYNKYGEIKKSYSYEGNRKNIQEKTEYLREYDSKGFLELEICFEIDRKGNRKRIHTKKIYYH